MSNIDHDHLYDTADAAAAMGMNLNTFKSDILNKRIEPDQRIGGSLAFRGSTLIAHLKRKRKPGRPPVERTPKVPRPPGRPRQDGRNIPVTLGGTMEDYPAQ